MNRKYYSEEKNFWDNKGSSIYWSLSVFDQQRIFKWIDWHGNGRVLDIGGGSGMVSRLLDSQPNTQCVCIDISLSMLKHASVTSVQTDALCLPFRENSFDLVVAAAFFHHLPRHDAQLLREIFRVLKPGGRLVGYDPNAHCIQNRLFMRDTPLRLNVFSPDELPIFPVKLGAQASAAGFCDFQFNFFSFRNRKITIFEVVQRYILSPLAIGPLRPFLERWFFWGAIKKNRVTFNE